MKSKQSKIQPQEENQLSQMIAGYLSYWPMFLISIMITTGAAYFYIKYSLPKYNANATVIIKDAKKGNADNQSMVQLDPINTQKIVENEIEVFQSRVLMEKVVNKLKLYAPITWDGKLRKESAYMYCPVLIEVKDPYKLVNTFDTTADIPLSVDLKNKTAILKGKYKAGFDQWINTEYGDLRFVPNPNFYDYGIVAPFYVNFLNTRDAGPMILSDLSADAVNKNASALTLTYKDEVPKRAEDILNNLIAFYNQATVEDKDNLVQNTLASIDSRLKDVKTDLDSIERKAQNYKATHKSTDLSEQSRLYLNSVNASDTKQGEVRVQLDNLNELEKYVTSSDKVGVLPSGAASNDVGLTQMMNNLSQAQINYEKARRTAGENNPVTVSYKEEVNKLKPDILANIKTQKRNLAAVSQGLSENSGKFNSLLNYIPQQEKQLLEITRDQTTKAGIYAFLLQKREETQLSLSSNIPDSKVVSYALADKVPSSPKKMIILLGGLMFGLIVPLIYLNVRELANSKILYRKEIESLTSIPVIGEIIHNKSKDAVVIEPGKRTFIAEEFRKIRVSLVYLGIDTYHKKILVTSSIPGEGKSFVASNLAISLAMTGKRVALVDMDLHNPSLGKMFNIPMEDPGVSDYLLGEKDAVDIINKIPSYENLFFIPAGALHPTPSELLENGQIQKLINYLDGEFDAVIMDGAPVVMVTDAYFLSSLADATLYIIRHKYTPKMLVKRIDENNKINTIKNPAIIFNGVKTKGFMKNNYGYGYDYVYGGDKKSKRKTSKSLT